MESAALLFRRACVSCPAEPPRCNCDRGQRCTLTVKTCDQCPEARCIDDGADSGKLSSQSASAIAGGVVGGLVGLGIILGLLFWCKFRHRRKRHLQALNEVALEFDTPSRFPDMESSSPEMKPPSIISTYGGASRHSNVIPILFPLNGTSNGELNPSSASLQAADAQSLHGYNRNSFIGPRQTLTGPHSQLVIRDSIRDSEYSFGSEIKPVSNEGLKAYDIAVQGLPSLVDMSKQKSPTARPATLRPISELEAASVVTKEESQDGRRVSRVPTGSRRSYRSSFAALPDPPSDRFERERSRSPGWQEQPYQSKQRHENRHHLTKPPKPIEDDDAGLSPFDDKASVEAPHDKYRKSVASSHGYIADLPEEVALYQGHGLI